MSSVAHRFPKDNHVRAWVNCTRAARECCAGRSCAGENALKQHEDAAQGGKKRAEELGREGMSELGKKGAESSPATGRGS